MQGFRGRGTLTTWAFWVSIFSSVSLHLFFASSLSLSIDEAHYALYAARPDLSYFDHPPLVGWIQWPLVQAGANDWVLRLIPQTLWLVSLFLAWRLAEAVRMAVPAWTKALAPGVAGRAAATMVLLTPLLHVLAIGLLPDTLLMVLVLLIMGVCLHLCAPVALDGNALLWPRWVFLGVLLGLAGLSKYTAILFAAGVAAALLLSHGWRLLRSPYPWLAALVAVVMVSPVFYWNALNDWISFSYQASHSRGDDWQLRGVLIFAALQLVAFGPLTLIAFWKLLRGIGRAGDSKLVWALGFVLWIPLLVTAMMAGGGRSLPHWMAPVWIGVMVLGSPLLAIAWREGSRLLLAACGLLQAGVSGAMFAGLFFAGLPGAGHMSDITKTNPFADVRGWNEAGLRSSRLAKEVGADVLAVPSWVLASRLAWYARPFPVVVLDQRRDQFDLWFGDLRVGQSVIFVRWSQHWAAPPIGPKLFQQCRSADAFDVERLGRVISRFELFVCDGWQLGSKP
jgi:4-amino-4-deoxy-L-arabinose transferase-like glycosyltransferase